MRGGGVFVLILSSLLLVGVFVTAQELPQVSDFLNDSVSPVITSYVQDFVAERGIATDAIESVTPVDLQTLPDSIEIQNVNDASLSIYAVNYTESAENKQVFVVTYATSELGGKGDLLLQNRRMLLAFGKSGTITNETFLLSAAGVTGSFETGYVMLRAGSITGLSTSAQNLGDSVRIVVYKNGEAVHLGNMLSGTGAVKDYDLVSEDSVTFVSGDVISVRVESTGTLAVSDITTLIELVTDA